MASFLARPAAAAATVELPEVLSESVGIRALQERLATEMGRAEPASDADLLALYRQYHEARKETHRVFAERCDSRAEADALIARRDGLLRQIATIRATTPRGFGVKMDVLRSCGCAALEVVCPENPGDILLQSVAADSYWLFGPNDPVLSEEEGE